MSMKHLELYNQKTYSSLHVAQHGWVCTQNFGCNLRVMLHEQFKQVIVHLEPGCVDQKRKHATVRIIMLESKFSSHSNCYQAWWSLQHWLWSFQGHSTKYECESLLGNYVTHTRLSCPWGNRQLQEQLVTEGVLGETEHTCLLHLLQSCSHPHSHSCHCLQPNHCLVLGTQQCSSLLPQKLNIHGSDSWLLWRSSWKTGVCVCELSVQQPQNMSLLSTESV